MSGATAMKRMASRDCVTGRARVDSLGSTASGRRRDECAAQGTDCRWCRACADGVVAFRGVDAQRILKEEFEIECSLSSTYRLLHRMQLSWLAPRPRHPEADATAQAAFSQLLDCN